MHPDSYLHLLPMDYTVGIHFDSARLGVSHLGDIVLDYRSCLCRYVYLCSMFH